MSSHKRCDFDSNDARESDDIWSNGSTDSITTVKLAGGDDENSTRWEVGDVISNSRDNP